MKIRDKFSFKRYPVTFLSLIFLGFILILLLFNRFIFAPKILLFLAIILVAVFLGKLKIVLKDWFVFLSFVYLFDSIRGTIYALICQHNLPVHTLYVIKMEKFLAGGIPSVFLQNLLLKNPENLDFGWFEKFLTAVHGTHFLAFLFVGLAIWLQKSKYFDAFKSSFYWITVIGVSGYLLIPTVPPWMAANLFGIIPKITRFNIYIYNMTIPDLTSGFNTNPIAAMPSLHAAFPALSSFILWRLYRWKAFPFYLYTLLMYFTIVYTGDHYFVDILAGVILAIPCYFIWFDKKAGRLERGSERTEDTAGRKPGFLTKNRHLVIGVLLLAIGIPLGLSNKDKFENDPDSYDYKAAPKYADFFRHENDYHDNFDVQFYFGRYYLVKKEYERALLYFRRALELGENIIERKSVLVRIKQIELILNQPKQDISP